MLRWGVILLTAALIALVPPTAAQASGRGAHDALVAKHAAANGVPEALVRRVIRIESRGNPKVVSKGNYGLMQIRLGTARAMGYTGSAEGLLDADTNMTYAVKYLAGAYRAADGNQDRAVSYYQRGYHASAKARGFSPYARPPVQLRQVAQAEVQPIQPSVLVLANTTPIPVRAVTPEIIRRPKSQPVEAVQQAPARAPAADPVRTQAWQVVATVPLPPSRTAGRETLGSPAPQPAQPAQAAQQQPSLALPHLAIAPPDGNSSMAAAPLQPVVSEPLPQVGAGRKTTAAPKIAAAPQVKSIDTPRVQQAASPPEPKLAAAPQEPKLAAAPQPRVAMTPDAIVAARFPVELVQRAQPVMALQPVAELRQQQALTTQPQPVRASADDTATGAVRLAARSEPPPAQAAAHEDAEQPKVRRGRAHHTRRSSHSRRHATQAQQPSLLASLQTEVSKNAAQPRAQHRQVRTVRRSSNSPTNLLAYLKKAVTPEKPRRRR
jgi:hypothetical protein